MKACSALVVGVLVGGTAAAGQPAGVVQWSIEKQTTKSNGLRRRASTVDEVIANDVSRGGYFATCSVGTPAQNLTLQLDTGSSDIWVPASSASICSATAQSSQSCSLGSFDSSKSTSFNVVGANEFSISYVDGSYSKGDYFTDTFQIGAATVKNATMGLGSKTDVPYGLVGIGYALDEAIVSGTKKTSSAYPNLPVAMVNASLINTIAYSLWLNDLDASTGSILFGGIDTKKYVGDLTRITVYPDSRSSVYTSFLVAMTSLQAVSPSGNDTLTSTEFPIPVVLDSGTTLSYLPDDLAKQVWKETGAIYSPELSIAVIPCSMAHSAGKFTFGMAGPNGPRITVGMDELVLPLTDDSGGSPVFSSGTFKGQTACEFGIQNLTSEPYLLGDTFLRSAYVVYDLVNNEIGIAATDFNATDSNIVAFSSLSAPIPSATTAANQNQVTVQPTFTTPAFAASSGFSQMVTATPSASSSGTSSSSGSGGSSGTATASSTSTAGSKNAAVATEPLDFARLAVLGVSMSFAVLGSTAFLFM